MTTEKNSNEVPGFQMTQMTEQQRYRAHPAIANSDLRYLSNPRLFQLYKQRQVAGETKDYHAFGSLVDDYLLSSQEEFDDKYVMQEEMDTPGSPNQKKFVQLIMNHEGDLQTADIASYYNQCYSKGNEEKALKLYGELKEYIDFQKIIETKTVYTEDDLETLNNITQNCRNNEKVNKLLFEEKFGWITFSHKQITDKELFGINWKGEMDRVIVDTVDKVIYNIDVKTSSKSLDSFPYYYMLYNYDRQQALYRELLKQELVDVGIIDDIDEYIIKTRCIYISSQNINQVACIPIPESVLQQGIDKLKDAAEKIKYHNEHGWDQTVSYMKNNGLDLLDWEELLNN